MRDANYAIGAVLVGTIVVTWTLGRFMKRFREPLGVLNAIVIRLCSGCSLPWEQPKLRFVAATGFSSFPFLRCSRSRASRSQPF